MFALEVQKKLFRERNGLKRDHFSPRVTSNLQNGLNNSKDIQNNFYADEKQFK